MRRKKQQFQGWHNVVEAATILIPTKPGWVDCGDEMEEGQLAAYAWLVKMGWEKQPDHYVNSVTGESFWVFKKKPTLKPPPMHEQGGGI